MHTSLEMEVHFLSQVNCTVQRLEMNIVKVLGLQRTDHVSTVVLTAVLHGTCADLKFSDAVHIEMFR